MSAPASPKSSGLFYSLAMLFLMLTAGVIGAFLGSALGQDALKGVTQPDFGLSSRTGSQKVTEPELAPGQTLTFLSEAKMLEEVKKRMSGQKAVATPTPTPAVVTEETPASKEAEKQAGFPIISQDGGVQMEVTGAKPGDGSLILEVSLKNQGTKPVRFLYSFLDVVDNQGRALSATADGLPGELPPLSDAYTGSIRIPDALLDGVETLSVSLTDYPDQKLKLKLTGIPVLKTGR
jgi:hypothetical protein